MPFYRSRGGRPPGKTIWVEMPWGAQVKAPLYLNNHCLWAEDVQPSDIEAYEEQAQARCARMKRMWGTTRLVETFSPEVLAGQETQ